MIGTTVEAENAGLLLAAARVLGIDGAALRTAPAMRAYRELYGGEELPVCPPFGTISELTALLEGRRRTTSPRALGVGWTPLRIVDAILEDVLEPAPSRGLLVDPACGSGVFVARAVERTAARHGAAAIPPLLGRLFAVDVDPAAVRLTRAVVELALLHAGVPISSVTLHIRHGDFLDDASWQDAAARRAGGAAAIFGNPPYVRLQDLDEARRVQLGRDFGDLLHGSFSLSQAFLVHGIRLLRDGGRLGFVTQNNFPSSKSARPIRAWLQAGGHMRRYVDFGYDPQFSGQSAYACLLFAGKEPRASFEFARAVQPADVASALEFSTIQVASLRPEKWRLANRKQLDDLEKLEHGGIPLGTFADIRVGFATLADRVFMLEQIDHECFEGVDGTRFLRSDVEGITQPAVRVPDLGKRAFAIITPYAPASGFTLIDESSFQRRFPRVYQYLRRNRNALDARDKGKPPREGWYAWSRRQGLRSRGPKWLTKTFDRAPNFVKVDDDRLFCNGYSVRPNELWQANPAASPPVFHRLLNSSAMEYHSRLTSFQISGNYQCYQKNFIERFAIPRLTEADARAIESAVSVEESNALVLAAFGIDAMDMPA